MDADRRRNIKTRIYGDQLNELLDMVNDAIAAALSGTHTNVVAKITAVNEKTIDCQPVVPVIVGGEPVELPIFVDVPPITMQGGSSYEVFPLAVGDGCLLMISERCFDGWYSGQDAAPPPTARMHDYSDGFALVGVNPLASAITIPGVITRVGDSVHTGSMSRTGDTELTGALDVTGNAAVDGDIESTGNIKGMTFSTANLPGATGAFNTAGNFTITVTNGLITGIA